MTCGERIKQEREKRKLSQETWRSRWRSADRR